MAVLLLGVLVASTVFRPLPYVTYAPGYHRSTCSTKDKNDAQEIIQVNGRETYRDGGELRMTTVFVSSPAPGSTSSTLMSNWVNPDDAVYPYDAVYAPDVDHEQNREEGEVEMVTSQDTAVGGALRELGYDVTRVIGVVAVNDGSQPRHPQGARRAAEVGGIRSTSAEDVARPSRGREGEPIDIMVRRGGKEARPSRP